MQDFAAIDFETANGDLTDLYVPPFSIHVIGFGKQVESVISKLSESGFSEISAYMAQSNQDIKPGDNDILAILCVDDDEEKAMEVSKIFFDANVLTLIVTTRILKGKYFDSMTKVKVTDIESVVKSLLDPIFLQGQISFDFNDLSMILRNSGHFYVKNAIGKGQDNRIQDALDKINTPMMEDSLDFAEYLTIVIYHNPELEPPMKMQEIVPLNDYLSKTPENINVIWAIIRDEKMPNDEIRLSLIISGKELKKC